MDELEISGKRYISSRRAAKQYKYHPDYIGQLIRGGKVVGTKVGRAWYVEAESLATYLGQEEFVGAPPPLDGVVYIGKPPVLEKKIEQTNYIGLTYVSDDEPLISKIYTHVKVEEEVYPPLTPQSRDVGVVISRAKKKHTSRKTLVLILATVVSILVSLAAIGSNFIAATMTVEQGKPTSVGYSLQ